MMGVWDDSSERNFVRVTHLGILWKEKVHIPHAGKMEKGSSQNGSYMPEGRFSLVLSHLFA
jgi:hypothetical protein